jgi:hypothetical protein
LGNDFQFLRCFQGIEVIHLLYLCPLIDFNGYSQQNAQLSLLQCNLIDFVCSTGKILSITFIITKQMRNENLMRKTILLAFTGVLVFQLGSFAVAEGEKAPPKAAEPSHSANEKKQGSTGETQDRNTPVFFLQKVIAGEDAAEGLAPEEMEKDWQDKTLSKDKLRVKVSVVTRYKSEDNEGRKCARVKAQIGIDNVPLKGKTHRDCKAGGLDACKPFYITSELDVCDDGMPPTQNYEKYKDDAANKDWTPPVTEIK